MFSFFVYLFEMILYVLVILLIVFIIYEWVYVLVVFVFGDDIVKNEGRFFLNFVVYIDLFGLLMILIVGFGWVKLILVNWFKLKKCCFGSIFVLFVGLVSNLLFVMVGVGLYVLFLNYFFFIYGFVVEIFLMIFV